PLLMATPGVPTSTEGKGSDYVVPILHSNDDVAALVWALDTHSYWCDGEDTRYGCIEDTQVSWVSDTVSASYTHPTSGEVPPSLVFFHIPMQQWSPDRPGVLSMHGQHEEQVCWAEGGRDILNDLLSALGNAWVMSVGHDHVNNFCLETSETVQPGGAERNVSLCYGSKTGPESYNDGVSGGRVFDLHIGPDGALTIETYIAREIRGVEGEREQHRVRLAAGSGMVLATQEGDGEGEREYVVEGSIEEASAVLTEIA
ncbi:hypothetical protein KIPB_009967, partial [Kipferlia bialata]